MTTDADTPTAGRTRRSPPRTKTVPPVSPAKASRSKLDTILDLLSRPEGASLAELVAATGWQAHSVRGALAGSLKRKGHAILSEKVEGERRYCVGAGQ